MKFMHMLSTKEVDSFLLRGEPEGLGAEVRIWPDASDAAGVTLPCQTHTVRVGEVADASMAGTTDAYPDTDGLVTLCRGAEVGVRTADCVPVVVYAPGVEGVGAVHSGWKGTLGNITGEALRWFESKGADMSEVRAYIGPAVCGDCYEVDEGLAERFVEAGHGHAVSRSGGKPHIDLRAVVRRQLIEAGLRPECIEVSPCCTRHSTDGQGRPLYPSWRREPGIKTRLLTSIRLL